MGRLRREDGGRGREGEVHIALPHGMMPGAAAEEVRHTRHRHSFTLYDVIWQVSCKYSNVGIRL